MNEVLMTSLLMGQDRIDLSRVPGEIERSVLITLLQHGKEAYTLKNLSDQTVVAAMELESLPAVSVVASIVACMAVWFPEEFYLTGKIDQKLPTLLELLGNVKDQLYGSLFKAQTELNGPNNIEAREKGIYERWTWGATFGLLNVFRWAYVYEQPLKRREDFEKSYKDYLIPLFLRIIDTCNVDELPNPLEAKLSEVILDLAKERKQLFDWLMVEVTKQQIRKGLYGFGEQVLKELKNRFWFSRSSEEQKQMIANFPVPGPSF